MKKFVLDFLLRGAVACGIGPIVLAIVYLILQKADNLESLTVAQICTGIFSISALAFVSGGINAIYKIERLPLLSAIAIHGIVLYVSYLLTYLVNDWLDHGIVPIIAFTIIFAVGYIIIWIVIYSIIRKNIQKVNDCLIKNQ